MPNLSPASHPHSIALDVRMWRHTGIGRYLQNLAAELARLDPPPRLICLGPDALAQKAASHHPLWRTFRFDAPVYGLQEQIQPASSNCRCTIYHAPHYNFPLRWPASQPLVVTLHDLIHLHSPNALKRLYIRHFIRRLESRKPGFLRIIVGSEATRERLLEIAPQIRRDQVRLVPYGIAPAFLKFQPTDTDAKSWRDRSGLPQNYLLMVGNALPHKNHRFVLETLAHRHRQHKDTPPLIVAGIGAHGVRDYRKIVEAIAPDAPIILLPHVRERDMAMLYASAHALIFPSLEEGYGLPIIEAQAVGCPTLVSDRPAPREAGGNAALFFEPTEPDSLLAALDVVLTDSERRLQMIARGRERTADMTWGRTARQTADVYAELAGDSVFIPAPGAIRHRPPQPEPRFGIVHDWLNGKRGGERVLEDLLDIWPDSDVFTLFYEPHRVSNRINRHSIHPSPLQRLPLTRRYYRHLLPFFPAAMRRMDLCGCDAVISISHCAAKAAPAPPGVPHICYCLTPARYFYDQAESYFGNQSGPLASARRSILRSLRRWDQESAAGVTHFIAISRYVAERIRRIYHRKADVVYPSVETEFFTPPEPGFSREDFFITVSNAVPYKRLDVAVDAFNLLGWPLLIVGRGPDLENLKRRAKRNIRFQPWIGKSELLDLYRRARGFVFAAEEDFGIAPVEAQACGCPVIAFGRGGASETIIDDRTGILFDQQHAESLIAALRRFNPGDYSPEAIRDNALRFNPDRFRHEFLACVQQVI